MYHHVHSAKGWLLASLRNPVSFWGKRPSSRFESQADENAVLPKRCRFKTGKVRGRLTLGSKNQRGSLCAEVVTETFVLKAYAQKQKF